MKKLIIALLIIIGVSLLTAVLPSCETSEGLKYGTLQKVSHKTFPCEYYVAEFAYEGGRISGDEGSKSHSNTQQVEITKAAYDSLQNYIGDKVIFDYKDKGTAFCGESKKLTSIKRKSQ